MTAAALAFVKLPDCPRLCAGLFVLTWIAACTTATKTLPTTQVAGAQPPPDRCLAFEGDGDGVDAGPKTAIRCVGSDAGAASECPQGYQCNTGMTPPVCERLYCGPQSSFCSGTTLCEEGLECYEGVCTLCNVCGDRCAVDFTSDPANCGTCGNAVPKNRKCVDGVPTCLDGKADCDGVCTDTDVDLAHCGGCGQPVPEHATCSGGAPKCVKGYATCGGAACMSLAEDKNNCTACGKRCAAPNAICTDLGGGGCLREVSTTTPQNETCSSMCSIASLGTCVDGSPDAVASYEGTSTQQPAPCGAYPPQSVTEGGVVHAIKKMVCACLTPAQ